MKNKEHQRRSQYGICHICKNDIDNAGLDHNHCPKCGWIVDSVWLKAQAAARKSSPKERRPAEKHINSAADTSESGAGSLLGIGMGAIAGDNDGTDRDVSVGDTYGN